MSRLLIFCSLLAAFMAGSPTFAQKEGDSNPDLKAFGGELKAAVLLGILDEESARDLYFEILEFEYADQKGEGDELGDEAKLKEDDQRRGGMTFARFMIGDEADFTTLLRPEYLSRDLQPLARAVGGEAAVVAVIESLLEDYERAFETASAEFQDSLERTSKGHEFDLVRETLDLISTTPLTRDEIDRRLLNVGNGKGLGARDPARVGDWAEKNILGLQSRIERLRDIVVDRQEKITAKGEVQSTREILAMMEALRRTRKMLRQQFEADLRSVISEMNREDIEAALVQIRLEHGRLDARFGGADIDVASAVRRTGIESELEQSSRDRLQSQNIRIADLIDVRTTTRIEREVRSARLLTAEVDGAEDEMIRQSKSVMDAANREISAGIAVRDANLALMMDMHASILESDPTLAAEFLEETRRDGFPDQMRRRWCERALEAAILIPDLDSETMDPILGLEKYAVSRLVELRARAINDRLEIEPRIARAMADGMEDDFAAAKSMGEETWREPGFEQFDRLDDEVGRRLLAILGRAGVDTLPRHASLGTLLEEKPATWKAEKTKGKTGGGADEKSRGNGPVRKKK